MLLFRLLRCLSTRSSQVGSNPSGRERKITMKNLEYDAVIRIKAPIVGIEDAAEINDLISELAAGVEALGGEVIIVSQKWNQAETKEPKEIKRKPDVVVDDEKKEITLP